MRIDTEELHRLADNPDHTHLELTSAEVKLIATELDKLYQQEQQAEEEERVLAEWLDTVARRKHGEA